MKDAPDSADNTSTIETVDARGQACPKPLIATRKVIAKTSKNLVEVLVTSSNAAANVASMARDLGWSVTSEETAPGETRVVLDRS